MKHTSAELKRLAREQLNGRWGLAIGVNLLVQMIISGLLTPFYFLLIITGSGAIQSITYMVAAIIISAVSMVLQCGILRIYFGFARNQEVSVGMVFGEFTRRPDRYILGYILIFVVEIVCMLPGAICLVVGIVADTVLAIMIGGALYIIGFVVVIYVSLRLSQIFYLLVEHGDMSVIEAFRTSSQMMEGNMGRFFYIYVSFIGWSLLGLLSCGIGMLWVTPYMMQTNVNFYRDLIGELDVNEEVGKDNEWDNQLFTP